MPSHLQDWDLDNTQGISKELATWLEQNGEWVLPQENKAFEKCISEGLHKEVSKLWDHVQQLLKDKGVYPEKPYWSVFKPQLEGGWLFSDVYDQFLIPIGSTGDCSSPYITDGNIQKPFAPGKAIFCERNKNSFTDTTLA
ncbi:Ureohydrolase [Macrophomina phaseolina MS6]|uniref:Ureohydrolase n=1 Tax=Macrophomina phaseolina (strain MS6) TaxID=1126212 RepID=K2RRA0_MACPH|nr:Ureohydrolase [Macrophomina phaseolina MS6]